MLSLRKTTFIIVLAAFIVLVSVIHFTFIRTVLPRFTAIEHRLVLGNLEQASVLPMDQSRELAALNRLWAWKDSTYQFALDKDPAFIEANLRMPTFSTKKLHLIGFYDTTGQVVWGAHCTPASDNLSPIPWDFEDFVFSRVAPWGKHYTGRGFQGIARFEDTLWVLSCEQILTSQEEGPRRGWLLMGRILAPETLEEEARKTNIDMIASLASLVPEEADNISPEIWEQDDHIYARILLTGIDGMPTLQITVKRPTTISGAGRTLTLINFAITGATALIVGLLIMWLLQHRVLNRIFLLARQARGVAKHPREAYDIVVPGEDEITTLASDINGMLQKVKDEERFLEKMMYSLPVGVMLVSVDERCIVEINPFACRTIGMPCEEIKGKICHGFICPSKEKNCPMLDLGEPYKQQRRVLINASGEKIPILKSATPITRNGTPLLLETFVDIRELETTRQALEESEDRYRTIFMNTGTANVIINEDTTIALANSEFHKLAGYSPEEIEKGLSWTSFFHADDVRWMKEYHTMRRENDMSAPQNYEARILRKDGEIRNVELTVAMFPGTSMSIASILDITDRKVAERELAYKAFYDDATGLPNRQLFHEHLLHAMENARRNNSMAGIMFLAFGQFKSIRENHDTATVNDLLKQVGAKLRISLRKNDTIAHLGNESYAILTEHTINPSAASMVAQKIIEIFDKSFDVGGTPMYLTANMGVVLFPLDGDTPEELMSKAELALGRARLIGENTFNMYTSDLNEQAVKQLELETALRRALAEDQFEVWYQPLLKLPETGMYGVEALIRWRKPDGTLIMPEEFIPFAEGTSLIRAMDLFVMEQACRQCIAWKEELGIDLTLAVNISSQHFRRGKLLGQVTEILDRTGLMPERLELELTETMLMENFDIVVPMINEFKSIGVSFALDDFGTGYSSLYSLRELSISTLKIDKVFIDMLDSNKAEGESFVRTIVSMAESLDMETVAEGVESRRQFVSLKKLGCTAVQGYLFSPPVNARDLGNLLRAGTFPMT